METNDAVCIAYFLGNLFQQLYNTVDSLIVGNFLGSNLLAAVTSSGNITFLLIGLLSGISIGAGVVVAEFFCAKDYENMSKSIHTIVAFGLVASVILTIIGVLLTPQILVWMDTPESVLPDSILYLKIYFYGSIGAAENERVEKGVRFGVITTVILAQSIGVIIYILASQLIMAFDKNPSVIEFGVDKARVSAIFYFLLAYSHALSAVLRGKGKAIIPMLVMLLCWCVIRVLFLTITIPILPDIRVVYWVYPLTWLLSSICFFVYYRLSKH